MRADVFNISRGGTAGPLIGWLADRVNPKKMMTVGAIITGLLWFALSRATSFGEFLAINGLFGICVGASTVIPCSLVIACVWRIADSGKISNSPQTG
jgi:MFS family permease